MSEPAGKSSVTVVCQVERDNLDELIAAGEAEHRPIPAEAIQTKREQLQQAREEQCTH
jgi:hypothetical protein